MTPLSVMLAELWQVNPSFMIVYNTNTRKTCIIEGEIEVSSEDTLDVAILCAWFKIFGKGINKNGIQSSH